VTSPSPDQRASAAPCLLIASCILRAVSSTIIRRFLRIGEFITDERAVFIVFVGRSSKIMVPGTPGTARGEIPLGVFFETQISLVVVAASWIRARLRQGSGGQAVAVAVRQNQFAAIDLHCEVQIIRIDARSSFGNQKIGQNQTGTLVFVAEVEQLGIVRNKSN